MCSDPFCHLHAHSQYSVKDGLAKPVEMIQRAKANGQRAIAVTDHGSLGAIPEMYRAAKEEGIQLIVGIEAYIVPNALEQKHGAKSWEKGTSRDRRNFHLTLLARNEQGYKDLVKLSSGAHTGEYHHYDPRMDYDMLREVGTENLICLSGCVMGELQETFLQTIRPYVAVSNAGVAPAKARKMGKHWELVGNGDNGWWWPRDPLAVEEDGWLEKGLAAARDVMRTYRGLFPDDNYFYELMYHEFVLERWAHTFLLDEAIRYGLEPVLTNDSHYVPAEHNDLHGLLMAMQWKEQFCGAKTKGHLDVCTSDQLQKRISDLVDEDMFERARNNTLTIAEMASEFRITPLEDKNFAVPKYVDENGVKPQHPTKLIYELAEPRMKILTERYPEQEQVYRDRFDYEMSIIKKFKYQHMFLITQAYVNFQKNRGRIVGAGRGSAAGSLVSFALGITEIDPIQRDLLFERFLDPDRQSMPDFDVDFPSSDIGDIYQWFYDRFGENNVKRVVAFQRLRPKGIIRGMLKSMGLMTHKELDELTKELDDDTADHGDEGFMQSWWDDTTSEKLKQIKDSSDYDLVEWSKQMYGLPVAVSRHAAAVVVGTNRMPLDDWIPLQYMSSDKSTVSQFDMDALDAMGFVKFDALTVRTLDTLQNTYDMIGFNPFEKIVEENGVMVYDDPKTLAMISKVQTDGLFQLSGGTAKQVLGQIGGAKDYNDIVAVMSLGRPGAVKFAGKYRANRDADWDTIKLAHPDLKKLLRTSYGVVLFQEDVMKILWHLGMSPEAVTGIMKAIKKKQYNYFDEHELEYLEKAEAAGWSEAAARSVWADMRDYAGYGFNKAHAESYADLAYKTGFLKAHYPAQFLAAKMRQFSEAGVTEKKREKLPGLVRDAVKMGVRVLPPDVNRSHVYFHALDDKTIIAGLADVKDVGDAAATKIIEVRKKFGPFTEDDFEPVYTRVGPRGGEYEEGGTLANCPKRPVNSRVVMALAYAGAIPGVEIEGRWEAEKELLYVNLSEHPNVEVMDYLRDVVNDRVNSKRLYKKLKDKETRRVEVGGVAARVKVIKTKPNKHGQRLDMAFVDLELDEQDFNVVVFPDQWEDYHNAVAEGRLVKVTCEMKADPKRGVSLIAENIQSWR
jgi:DNA polymerase-3 subunit alpha